MPRVVKRWPKQVVHGRIDDGEVSQPTRLEVAHARQQHACVADQEAPGLEKQLEWPTAEEAADRERILVRIDCFLVAVADADAAAEVDVLESDAVRRKPGGQGKHLRRRLASGLE